MEELRKFEAWVENLDLEWRNESEEFWRNALKKRAGAKFLWARSRAEKMLCNLEKNAPLNSEEVVWFEGFESVVSFVIYVNLRESNEFFSEI